jgi:uncharacterized damage-inducible protein DinB
MIRECAVMLALASLSAPALAQTTDAPYDAALSTSLATMAKTMHATIRRNLAEAAEAMTADEYAFRPQPEMRTFAQLVGHVINANFYFCAQATGQATPSPTNHEQLTDKAALVKALNESLALCDQAYAATTDENFMQAVGVRPLRGQTPVPTRRGAVLMFNVTHNNEHYGNMVVYLRLKGHVPPSTARARTGQR